MVEEKSCEKCDGACCKYVAMEIDCPEDLNDFENIKWYVAHENIRVFVEEDDSWNIEFITPCKYLSDKNKCIIHEDSVKKSKISRPKICKDFDVDSCPFHNDYLEKYEFNSVEDIEKYIKEIFSKGKHIVIEYERESE